MARTQGLTPFAANFEVEKRAPLDARNSVETQADLINPTTWIALDGNEYTYVGMQVAVSNDGINNGVYVLIASDYTDLANWLAVGSNQMPDVEEGWEARFQVTADFEANEVIDLTSGTGSIAGTCVLSGDNLDGVDRILGASAGAFFQNRALSVNIQGQGSMYKSNGAIFNSPTSLHFAEPLRIGDFFWIRYNPGMGTKVVGGWSSATSGTHAEIKALKDAGSLVPGEWYEITDYQTKHAISGSLDINEAPVEHLILEATSTSTFRNECLSKTNQDDYIYYDINNTTIGSNDILYGWNNTGTPGGDIDINVTGQRTFTIDIEPLIDSDFYGYLEDDNGDDFDIEHDMYNVLWTYTDIGGGLFEITIDNSVNIDLTTAGYSYIEIESKYVIGERKGWIDKRTYKPTNVSAPFDFRGVKMRLFKIDKTGFDWDSGISYNRYKLVYYNDAIYQSKIQNNIGNTPTTTASTSKWTRIITNVDNGYLVTNKGLDLYNDRIPAKLDEYVELGIFNVYDGTNYIDGLYKFKNVEAELTGIDANEMIFILRTYHEVSGMNIHKDSKNVVYRGNITNSTFGLLDKVIFDGNIKNSNFNFCVGSYFKSCDGLKLNGNTYGTCLVGGGQDTTVNGLLNGVTMGSSFIGNSIYRLNSVICAGSFSNNIISSYSYQFYIIHSGFSNNIVGSMMYFEYPSTYDFRDNRIGNFFRYNSFVGFFRENKVGDYFQYNDFTSHFHMNSVGNYFSGRNNSDRNRLANTYRITAGDYFGTYGRIHIDGSMNAVSISTDQRNWNIGGNVTTSTITSSLQDITIGGSVTRCNFFGQVNSVNLTGNIYQVTVTGAFRFITGDSIDDCNISGMLLTATWKGQLSRCDFQIGNQISGCDFGYGFVNNKVSACVNATFNQTDGEFTQRNEFLDVPNNTDFDGAGATHIKELYTCKLTMREGGVGVLEYIDSSSNKQIVSQTA